MEVAIRNSADHDSAMARLAGLIAVDGRTPVQSAELRSLAESVSEYEEVHYGSVEPAFHEIVDIRLEMMGSSVSGMAAACPALGGEERAASLLDRSVDPTAADLDAISGFIGVERDYLESSVMRPAT